MPLERIIDDVETLIHNNDHLNIWTKEGNHIQNEESNQREDQM